MKKPNPSNPRTSQVEDTNPEPEGYPHYPSNEDIYSQFVEEQDIDPEDITRKKTSDIPETDDILAIDETPIDELLEEEIMGTELDVPGAELDDDNEIIGNEDEENNYYSLGGDNHNNLEEDQGEEFP
jgi:hypothetical protein